jgi:hypothetical protein
VLCFIISDPLSLELLVVFLIFIVPVRRDLLLAFYKLWVAFPTFLASLRLALTTPATQATALAFIQVKLCRGFSYLAPPT